MQDVTTAGSLVISMQKHASFFRFSVLIADAEIELSFPATSWKSKENTFIFSVPVPFSLSVSPWTNAVQPSAC
jgi:hypothetical protein